MSQKPEGDSDTLEKIFKVLRDSVPENETFRPESVTPLIRDVVHAACHLAVGTVSSPEFMKICLEEYIEATRCQMRQAMDTLLTDVLEKRAETLPEDDKN